MSEAWAIRDNRENEILAKTVHETERGAVVNYLVTYLNVQVTNAWSDDAIFTYFRRWRELNANAADAVQVTIHIAKEQHRL